MSSEWMKLTAERVDMDKERVSMRTERVSLKAERHKLTKLKEDTEAELKTLSTLHRKWKKETADLMAEIDAKYTTLKRQRVRADKKEWSERRRVSIEEHVQNLQDLADPHIETRATSPSPPTRSPPPRSGGDVDGERLKLQRLQKEAKVSGLKS